MLRRLLPLAIVFGAAASGPARGADGPASPEGRALAYLASEAPRWSAENGCYSCHHNGDAARALYTARRLGFAVAPEALADTSRWLARPEVWDHNGGDGPFSDKRLARLQFAAALALGVAGGDVGDRSALRRAADRLAADQSDDGSWPIEGGDLLGSPTTYGRQLATALARGVLHADDPSRHRPRIERADRWLGGLAVRSVPEAAAVLLVHEAGTEPGRRAVEWLRRAQGPDGGWGPYPGSPPEPFDTALAVIALQRAGGASATASIARGRAALIADQSPDGSWPETTRPAGAESYAQRLSTSAWATLALLATAGEAPPGTSEARPRTRSTPSPR